MALPFQKDKDGANKREHDHYLAVAVVFYAGHQFYTAPEAKDQKWYQQQIGEQGRGCDILPVKDLEG
jgi:hypothetical protein